MGRVGGTWRFYDATLYFLTLQISSECLSVCACVCLRAHLPLVPRVCSTILDACLAAIPTQITRLQFCLNPKIYLIFYLFIYLVVFFVVILAVRSAGAEFSVTAILGVAIYELIYGVIIASYGKNKCLRVFGVYLVL